jgi:hypothetical protein
MQARLGSKCCGKRQIDVFMSFWKKNLKNFIPSFVDHFENNSTESELIGKLFLKVCQIMLGIVVIDAVHSAEVKSSNVSLSTSLANSKIKSNSQPVK